MAKVEGDTREGEARELELVTGAVVLVVSGEVFLRRESLVFTIDLKDVSLDFFIFGSEVVLEGEGGEGEEITLGLMVVGFMKASLGRRRFG